MAARLPFVIGFGLYAILLLSALAVGIAGLVAGPRPWMQRLCRWSLRIMGAFLLLLGVTLLSFAGAGMFHAAVDPKAILLLVFGLCSPLLLVFLGLLTVCLCRVSPAAGPPTPQPGVSAPPR
jgi:hypothetical protein